MMNNIEIIGNYLDELFSNPKCELLYNKDYELLIAIVLSAQSTDKRVNLVTPVLFNEYPSLDDLANANQNDIEDIIHSVGSYRRKASYIIGISKILKNEYNYKVPKNKELLEKFPGVGSKTANVFLSEYYSIPAIAVDTHVERVSKRLNLVSFDDNVYIIEKKLEKCFKKNVWSRRHLQMVLFGRYHCKAVKPECKNCKLKDICVEKKKNF